jgi:hypothetical protein
MSQTATDPIESVSPSVVLPLLSGDDPIGDLELILEAEGRFLNELDVNGIDAIAQQKEQLLGSLRAVTAERQDLGRLARVREMALSNQLLTVHARDAIGTILRVFTGAQKGQSYPPRPGQAGRLGARVSVKV